MQGVSNDSLYHVVMNYDITYIVFCIILPKRWVLTLLPLCPGPLTPALIARIVLSMLHRCFLFEFECRCFASKSQEGMQHSRIQVLHTNSHCQQCNIRQYTCEPEFCTWCHPGLSRFLIFTAHCHVNVLLDWMSTCFMNITSLTQLVQTLSLH